MEQSERNDLSSDQIQWSEPLEKVHIKKTYVYHPGVGVVLPDGKELVTPLGRTSMDSTRWGSFPDFNPVVGEHPVLGIVIKDLNGAGFHSPLLGDIIYPSWEDMIEAYEMTRAALEYSVKNVPISSLGSGAKVTSADILPFGDASAIEVQEEVLDRARDALAEFDRGYRI